MIRVLVVDDQPLVRVGVSRILGTDPDLEVVGECADGDEVVGATLQLVPDVVLMDVRMRRVDGVQATRDLRALEDPPPVLVLTTFGDDDTVAATLSAGAAGFVLKDAPGEELIRATRTVAEGGAWLDPAVTAGVIDAYRTRLLPQRRDRALMGELTPREREVLELVARGCNNQEVAAALVVSEATVKSHIGHILDKLQVRDRAAAIVAAYEHGVVVPGERPPADRPGARP
ncbi:response regulator [Nitriliruptor alkaliphilus]|uniref:response regulator n=1 Tax=Nitriliruptor alkaliphilus TaxID=427918 RepID=UPI001B80DCF2|nr:response regulator transcription factor [Nitriliruptor alkaliphilus]